MATEQNEPEEKAGTLDFIGGELCLDFTNTVSSHNTAQPNEYLTTYGELLAWSEHAGIVSKQIVRRLRERAEQQPADAQAVLQRALALREALYRVFSAVCTGLEPKATDLAVLNGNLAQALSHAQIVRSQRDFEWSWLASEDALDQMLWPVVRSAADLLTSNRLGRVRECEGNRCGWLFVDLSKNHSRRWCNMGDCGNRAKAHRFYVRQRSAAKPAA